MSQPCDELLERYAEAVAQDPRRPSDRVRNAARAHAQMLRDQAAVTQRAQSVAPPKPAANQPQWTISLVASLAVVGLVGLLYVQIDRGTPKDRDAALGTSVRTEAPATSSAASPAPPESPTPAMEAHQRSTDKPMAGIPPVANPPATAAPPSKPMAIARKEMLPGPAAAPVQDAAQTMAHATPEQNYSAPLAESDTAPKLVGKVANQLAGAGAMRDAKSATQAESAARMAPAAAMAPAARTVGASPAAALFMEAVRTGHIDAMQKLLAQGVAVNTRDDYGNTALMLAVRHHQTAAVRKLLALGADTTLVNDEGLTALQLANQLGLADMVQLLQPPQ
jgi:Meckel syndrome type 1 protein